MEKLNLIHQYIYNIMKKLFLSLQDFFDSVILYVFFIIFIVGLLKAINKIMRTINNLT